MKPTFSTNRRLLDAMVVFGMLLSSLAMLVPAHAQQEPVVGVAVRQIQVYGGMTIAVQNGGSGYVAAPVVTISGDGFGATAIANINSSGSVTSIQVQNPGAAYTTATVTISPPDAGVPPIATATVTSGAVTGVSVTSGGSGFTAPPTVTFSGGGGGSGAAGTATVSGGQVTGVTITSGGSGYTSAPSVSFSSAGVVATAIATVQNVTFGSLSDPTASPNEAYGPYGTPITITSVGTGTFLVSSFTYEWFVNGTSIGHTNGPILPPTPASIPWTPPQPGAYLITCSITDGTNKATSLAVRYYATGAVIVGPNDGLHVPYGSSVVLQATATPPPRGGSGFVDHVDFLVDGVKQGSDSTYPYSIIYTPPVPAPTTPPTIPAATTHTVDIVAYDNTGNIITPPAHSHSILMVPPIGDPKNPTTVKLVNPIDGASISSGTTVHMIADAVAPAGFIKNVDFYVNGVVQTSAQTFPFTSDWKPLVPGQYQLVAIAFDDKSNTIASPPVNITVTGVFPTAGFKTPPPSSVLQGAKVQVEADASGAGGGIATLQKIDLMVDGNVYDTLPKNPDNLVPPPPLTAPFLFDWISNVALGVHQLAVRVTDNNGLTITSASVPVTVGPNKAPLVSITSPESGGTVVLNSAVTITASATDSDDPVATVEFFVNDISLGAPVKKPPFQWTWTPTVAGPYKLTAKAIDSAGAGTISDPVSVIVTPITGGTNVVYRGTYGSTTESGQFTLGIDRASKGTFIGTSTTPKGKIYFWTGFTVNSDGSFSVLDSSNKPILQGQTNAAGVSGSFGDKTFIGPVTTGGVAPLVLSGTLNSDSNSTVVALVGADNIVTLYLSSGGKVDSATGTVGLSGTYSATTTNGGTISGNVSSLGSLVSGSSTGPVSGGFVVLQKTSRLVNISTRVTAGSGDATLIAGFIVSGSGKKALLVRGVGPSLAAFGVSNPLPNPTLAVVTTSNANVANNDDWGNAADIASAGAQVGAFPLFPDSHDAAVLTSVTPGGYSAIIGGAENGRGAALVEIYDLDSAATATSRLMNISSRAYLTNGDALLGGFVISGDQRKTLLIRAVGPTLSNMGIANVLPDPKLDVLLGTTTITTNTGWTTGPHDQISSTTSAVGAFPLSDTGSDSALVIQLGPGAYTAEVTSVNGLAGVTLLEIYDADP